MQQAANASRASTSSMYSGFAPSTFHRSQPDGNLAPSLRSTNSSRGAPPDSLISAPRNRSFADRISNTPDISVPSLGLTDQPNRPSTTPTPGTLPSSSSYTPSTASTIPRKLAKATALSSSRPQTQLAPLLTSTDQPKNSQYSTRSSAEPPAKSRNDGIPSETSSRRTRRTRHASQSSFAFNKSKATFREPDSNNIMWPAQTWGDEDAPSRKPLATRRRQLMSAYIEGIAMAFDVAAQYAEEIDGSEYATTVASGEAYLSAKFGSENWRRMRRFTDVSS